MAFNSLTFIFIFLPLSVLLYYIMPEKLRNIILLVLSLVFYMWNSVENLLLLLISILVNYIFGILIGKFENKKRSLLILGLSFNILFLVYFKYTNFILENLKMNAKDIILPLGISFFTFQEITYLVSVYKDKAKSNKNILEVALYISLFTNITSGPIARYDNMIEQLRKRSYSFDNIYYGVQRFIIGLGKKVLISNTIGLTVDNIFAQLENGLDTPTAWIGAIGYTLQLYFDFSGYTDMALGIGKMFGFDLPENFNYPLIATGMSDFWKRWHITLSTFFRDYIYIPLGGNRNNHTTRNLLIVFLTTGIWHGANWTFVIWGLWNFVFSYIEKFTIKKKELTVSGRIVRTLVTFIIVVFGFVIFRAENLTDALLYFKNMFSFGNNDVLYGFQYYLTNDVIIAFIIGLLASTPLFKLVGNKVFSTELTSIFKDIFLMLLFILCLIYIVSGSYSPFIYFQF